jgi:rubrerythrin
MTKPKRWQCVVCGYIHDGAVPPKTCPTCGVDASRFVVFK